MIKKNLFVVLMICILFSILHKVCFSQKKVLDFYPTKQKFALLIGISKYQVDRFDKLDYAEQDADKFKRYLIDYFNFSAENITTLKGSKATYNNILNELRKLSANMAYESNKTGRKCLFVLYFSGHGTKIDGSRYPDFELKNVEHSAIIPYDALPYAEGISAVSDRYITDEEIKRQLGNAKRDATIVFILDACYQGSAKVAGPVIPQELSSGIYPLIADALICTSGAMPVIKEAKGGLICYALGKILKRKPVYSLKEIFYGVQEELSKTFTLSDEQKPKLPVPIKQDIFLFRPEQSALEVKLTQPATIEILDKTGNLISAENDKESLVEVLPTNKEFKVTAYKTVERSKQNNKWNETYSWESGFFRLTPEEYKVISVPLEDNLKPAYIKVLVRDRYKQAVDLISENEEFSGIWLVGVPRSEYTIEKTQDIYKVKLKPGYYEEITVEKEGYKIATHLNNENIVLSSDDIYEVMFELQEDVNYWKNKIQSLENIQPRTPQISYQIAYCYWKDGVKTKSQNLLNKAYKHILDAYSQARKQTHNKDQKQECKKYVSTAYSICNFLAELTQNKKYKDDAEHFKNLETSLK